jgi:restriction system-associated AAA family ATPase
MNLEQWDELRVALINSNVDPLVQIKKKPGEFPVISAETDGRNYKLKNRNLDREPGILPTRVIGYSSGMNELLSNPFIKIDFQYLKEFNQKKNESKNSQLGMNRLFFMDYNSNKFITIANFIFDAADYEMSNYADNVKATDFGGLNLNHLKKETGIQDIVSFSLHIQLEKIKGAKYEYLPSELNIALDKLKRCASFCQAKEDDSRKDIDRLTIRYDYWVNNATKAAFRDQFRSAYELFRALYFLNLLNNELVGYARRDQVLNAKAGSLDNISEELPKFEKEHLRFRLFNIRIKKNRNQVIEYRKLSDGEHQLLQVMGSLMLIDTEGALFLLDEPETHFNPTWRSKFVQYLEKSITNERQQEILMTTHSPFIVSDCKRENVYVFERDDSGKIKPAVNPDINTYGTAASIISDEIFGKSETVSNRSLNTIENIKKMPMNSLDQIQLAKEASRVLGDSPEKVLLFRELLLKEDQVRGRR